MRMYDVITAKKRGMELTDEQIAYVVKGFTNGEIPDYQVSALLMAICLKGLNMRETTTLTMEMARSGEMLDLSAIHGKKADKHSTGGVGDKTTLIVAPIVASLGIPVAKMSGRGLGHTGGTIDKLESIPGFRTTIPADEFIRNVNEMKLAVAGQSANLAPADKKLYALRDVTATVDNISLIASSIMSKKLASGADVIVLDVKTGSGAFMKTYEDSAALAQTMVTIGNNCGRKTYAVITDMNQVLGRYVGNWLEVREAMEILAGGGDEELRLVSVTLASYMILGCGKAATYAEASAMAENAITSGAAMAKFKEFVGRQGGDVSFVDHPETMRAASVEVPVYAPQSGYVSEINAEEVGMSSLLLGGGREKKEDAVDPIVGIRVDKKVGDPVQKGDLLGVLYANDPDKVPAAKERFLGAYRFSEEKVPAVAPIYGYVDDNGVHNGTI
ncbi:MAG: pyrimidine-nucleoside phosphorylase [Lachnospiraceae bacterium]|nr:pyrimidine-nucleoside phosphorylase [Lachnospiraceae bacterium]